MHNDLRILLVDRHRICDHQPRLANHLELGAPVIREQILDRRLVKIKSVCDMAYLYRSVIMISGQHPPGRGIGVQLQYVAQVFAGEILGDDLVAGPDPAQRRRSVGNSDRHPGRLAPLPTTHFCDECCCTQPLAPQSVTSSAG
jgi:hypothetical protein